MQLRQSTLQSTALVFSFALSLLYFFMAGTAFQIAGHLGEVSRVLASLNAIVFFLGGLLSFWWALAMYRFCLGGLPPSEVPWKRKFSSFIDNAINAYRAVGPFYLMGKGLNIMSALLMVALGASKAHGLAVVAVFVIWIGHTLAQLRVYVESLMLLQPDFAAELSDVVPKGDVQRQLVRSLDSLAAFSFGAACINLMRIEGWTNGPTAKAAALYAVFGTTNVFAVLLWKKVLSPALKKGNN